MQVKALASGSVVDSTFEDDMASVILPMKPETAEADVEEAWEKFATARRAEAEAIALVDAALGDVSGVRGDPVAAFEAADGPVADE